MAEDKPRRSASVEFGEELSEDAFADASTLVAYPVQGEEWRQLITWLQALSESSRISNLIIPVPSGSHVLEELGHCIQALGEFGYGVPHTLTIAPHRETYFGDDSISLIHLSRRAVAWLKVYVFSLKRTTAAKKQRALLRTECRAAIKRAWRRR